MKSIQIAKSSSKVAKQHSHFSSLGVDTHDPLKTVRMIRAGLPFKRLGDFQKATGLSWEKLGDFVAIPQRTLSRRQNEGRLSPEESDRVLCAPPCSSIWQWSCSKEMLGRLSRGCKRRSARLDGEMPLEFASTAVAREKSKISSSAWSMESFLDASRLAHREV